MHFLQIINNDTEAIAVAADSTLTAKTEHLVESVKGKSFEEIFQLVSHEVLVFGWTLLKVIIIFYVGRWIIRKIIKVLRRIFERRHLDSSLQTFIVNFVSIILYILLIFNIIHIIGLSTTSFIAIFASAGLAIGLALSGTMQNFAGGIMILLLRPYRVGDYIAAQGQEGTVKSIQLFNTVINTSDNKTVLIPNGPMSTGIVNNYSAEPTRRVEWIIGVAYGNDFDKARTTIEKILQSEPKILNSPSYLIEISQLTESSVNITIRAWVNSTDFWSVYFGVNEKLYSELPANEILFQPANKMDVRLTKD